MNPLLHITVVDVDPAFLRLEVRAASTRFAGTARIYAGLGQLDALASLLEGFPNARGDRRQFAFGDEENGHVALLFHCEEAAGSATVHVTLQDDDQFHDPAAASFRFSVEPAEIDRFQVRLRALEQARSGEALLSGVD